MTISWNTIRQRGQFRYIIRYALGLGLPMGICIPFMNAIILPPPNYNILEKLAFSVPFFVISWGTYGAYSWFRNEKKHHQSSQDDF